MEKIWTLIIKTSLPNVAKNATDIKTIVQAFESFEDAKKVLRAKLKEYAFTENSMFDGAGHITKMLEYSYGVASNEDEEVDAYLLNEDKINKIIHVFAEIFQGKDVSLKMAKVKGCTDWMVGADWDGEVLEMYGTEEGPYNGYDPYIKTNMFDMTKEKDYYLYIDDMFGQDSNSSELYIDLIKTTLHKKEKI